MVRVSTHTLGGLGGIFFFFFYPARACVKGLTLCHRCFGDRRVVSQARLSLRRRESGQIPIRLLYCMQQRIKLCIMHNGSATAVFCTQAMCRLSIVCKHSVTATGLVAPHSNIRPWFGDRFVLHGTIKPNGF